MSRYAFPVERRNPKVAWPVRKVKPAKPAPAPKQCARCAGPIIRSGPAKYCIVCADLVYRERQVADLKKRREREKARRCTDSPEAAKLLLEEWAAKP